MSNVETSGYPVVKEAELRYAHLMFVQVVIDHLPKYVLIPVVLVGYAGFSLDLLLKRLRMNAKKSGGFVAIEQRLELD